MYNIYKYQEEVRQQQSARHQDQNYAKWMIRHEQFKNKSVEHTKQRITHFVHKAIVNPIRVEDDHYKTWRVHKQFRDVEDQNKFLGFKTFRHKPNYDIGRHFSERQRKEISHISEKSKVLVQNSLIPDELRSRSLRSQGPLNPKHSFRDKKPDHEVLQPRMRYHNVTDKDRLNQLSATYDTKFSKVYQNFSQNKSKIGVTKISPKKDGDSKSFNLDLMSSTYSDKAKGGKIGSFLYDALNQEEKNKSIQLSKFDQASPSGLSPTNSIKKQKVYLKGAKTMALHGHDIAKNLMIQTQYDRKKDLTNLNKNIDNQSFVKRPIL